MHTFVPVIVAYLLGSISFSFLYGKWFKGIDIRKHGSGNAGATNTLRVIGVGPAIAVLLLDAAKGVAAVWIGKWLGAGADVSYIPALAGLAAIAGHNWPIFFGFRGGKGIATTIGAAATLCFLPTLFAGIAAIVVIAATRYVSLGSLVLAALLPVLAWWMNVEASVFWTTVVIGVFAFVRHRTNIVKLVKGKESKIGQKSGAAPGGKERAG
ncbi:glycerol-3-phosphate 1-O-acyltransferase PlsY [Paenibacillus flagellatus]|uniref:Glycerol-3-phosphate acyltransferase n=1 Tax=Paenibacillus flagellatus TaxID=2211139 RepID=A0A2V5KAR0_9BACL|nr:glycerol-3-phosphate 1-O-acyltransferase PlsY [Paenibacillus flagellatus]PYI54953.1 acyl-phosphate glycerol 3-phosphate acyltransferase [Paenibacillus flagellatus]